MATLTRNKLAETKINCSETTCATTRIPGSMTSKNEMKQYLDVLHDDWKAINIDDKWHLKREFEVKTKSRRKLKKLKQLNNITQSIFQVSKKSNYHPNISIEGVEKVILDLYSKKK
eukprot:843966_1